MNQHIRRLIALVLACAMCLSLIPFGSAAPDAETEEIPEDLYLLLDPLWEQITETETAQLAAQHVQSVEKADLSAIAQVVTASEYYVPGSLQWQGSSRFTFDTTIGIPCAYSARLREQARNAKPNADLRAQPDAQVVEYGKDAASGNDVYLIGPYYGIDDSFTNQYQNEAKSVAQALGSTYTLYKTTAATIDKVAEAIQSGAVVFFDSHGDTNWVNPRNEDDFVTGAKDSYLLLQTGTGITNADYQNEHAVYGGSYYSMKYYMVDGVAITNHMTKDAGDCLVWMAICLGMATDGLNKPLRAHGVDVVYGYSQSVTFDGDYCFETTFWSNMKQGSTVAEAIQNMKADWGCWDCSSQIGAACGWPSRDWAKTITQARDSFCAFPIVVSDEDAYPGHGNVDDYQTVYSSYTLFGSYNVTAVSSDTSKGTVSVNGHTVTATPAEGYYASGYTLSPADAATVTQDGNTFRLSDLKADCTITIRFDAKSATTVHFEVPEGVTQKDISTYVGDTIVLPTPSGKPTAKDHDYQFEGWVDASTKATMDKPVIHRAGEEFVAGKDSVLYALYSYTVAADGSVKVFEQINSARDSWAAEYAITGGSQVLDASGDHTGTAMGSVDAAVNLSDAGLTVSGTELKGVTDNYIYVLAAVPGTDAYTIRMKNSSNYLSCSKASNLLDTTTDPTDTHAQWTLSVSGGAVTIANVFYPNRTLRYNKSSKVFRCYTSGQEAVTLYGTKSSLTYFLTLDNTVTPPPHEHSWSAWTVTKAATCVDAGEEARTCACGEKETRAIAALGHDEVTDKAVAATCTEAGKTEGKHCARCEQVLTKQNEVPALGHAWDEGTVTTAATCTEAGVKAFACARCDETKTEAIPTIDCPTASFTDVKTGAWYHDAADWAVANGYITGIGSTFQVTKKANRAMLATILYRMAGEPDVEGMENPFPDVKEKNYFYKAALWANDTGVITGSNGLFAPNVELSRETAATILYRFAQNVLEADVTVAEPVDLEAKFPADGAKVSGWAKDAMVWAVSNGLINGNKIDGIDMLDAKGKANRGQLAIILMNFDALTNN